MKGSKYNRERTQKEKRDKFFGEQELPKIRAERKKQRPQNLLRDYLDHPEDYEENEEDYYS